MQNNEPLKLKKILNRESKSFLEKKEDEQKLISAGLLVEA